MPEAEFQKLSLMNDAPGSLTDRVYTSMKSAILRLDLVPGAIIRKSTVCEQFGVSRAPVSDAFTRLATEGLVDVVPQSGTRVARLSMAAIREDSFLREALEVAAARHAAVHRSAEIMARLTRNVELQKLQIEDVDKEDFIQTDADFHDLIMSTTHVSRLPATVRHVSTHLERARFLLVPEPGRLGETLDEHVAILNAIGESDPDAAQDAMRIHVQQLLKRLEPLESERPELFST